MQNIPEARCAECKIWDARSEMFYGGIEEGGGDWADENVDLWYCADCASKTLMPRFEAEVYGGE